MNKISLFLIFNYIILNLTSCFIWQGAITCDSTGKTATCKAIENNYLDQVLIGIGLLNGIKKTEGTPFQFSKRYTATSLFKVVYVNDRTVILVSSDGIYTALVK